MRLSKVRIKKFRNIVDSGEVVFDEKITCLVGLNEAGKTTLLQALLRLNPHDGSTLRVQEDYPRWLWKRDERAGEIEGKDVIDAIFLLDDADVSAIETVLGKGTVRSREVSVSRRYGDDSMFIGATVDEKKCVANLLDKVGASGAARGFLSGAENADELKAKAEATDDEVLEEEMATIMKAVNDASCDFIMAARKVILQRIPTFFYFDNYAMLPGRIDIAELNGVDGVAATGLQTARSLLSLANTTPAELAGEDYEDRKAELEAVSADLTDEVFNYWQQNVNLRVQFDIDKKVLPPPSYNMPSPVQRWLEIRVENTEHRYSSNFDRRSHGFQWFFSFLAAFTEFERQQKDQNFVILLDEPGLSLHGLAQRDLLRFINDRLGHAVQVVYTTHSPFMVETDHIERVRIVEDKGKNIGAQITQEVLHVGDKSLFPLQTALGYDASQHLFVGNYNVAVEGPSDVLYLTILSRRLNKVGMTSLDEKWVLIPTGGANNLPGFIALLGSKVDVTVVMDSGTEGGGKIQAALDAGRIKKNRLIHVGEIIDRQHADIEDLFSLNDYLTLFNKTFGTAYSEADLGPGNRIIKRLEAKESKFDHYRPADTLLRNPDVVDTLSKETLENFAALMEKVNKSRRR